MLFILIFKNVMHVKLDSSLNPFSRAKKIIFGACVDYVFPTVILGAEGDNVIAVMIVSKSKSPTP